MVYLCLCSTPGCTFISAPPYGVPLFMPCSMAFLHYCHLMGTIVYALLHGVHYCITSWCTHVFALHTLSVLMPLLIVYLCLFVSPWCSCNKASPHGVTLFMSYSMVYILISHLSVFPCLCPSPCCIYTNASHPGLAMFLVYPEL